MLDVSCTVGVCVSASAGHLMSTTSVLDAAAAAASALVICVFVGCAR